MSITRDILFVGRRLLDESIIKESIIQGHYLTGNFQRSFTAEVTEDAEFTVVATEVASYGVIVNDGVVASRIPFRQGSGAKTSKYIDGLKAFFMLKGLPEKEAERAAFATAISHKRQGMPTANSFQYSKNGKRQLFIEEGIKKALPKANRAIMQGFNREVQRTINKVKSGTI